MMKKLTVKELIEFRHKSLKGKKCFVNKMKLNEKKPSTGKGGNYWISCLSAISNSFRTNNSKLITDKIDELDEKFKKEERNQTKNMYKRNIDILVNYIDFDFQKWRPTGNLTFLKKHKADFILPIQGLEIKATPHHVFTFQQNSVKEVGAIWFIAKLNGYRKDELGMFVDILHRYLKTHFSTDYNVRAELCIAVDIYNLNVLNYSQLQKAELNPILSSTVDEIKLLVG